MAYRIQNLKPKLKKGGKEVDGSGVKPNLSYDSSSDIIMFREESWFSIVLSWIKTSLLFGLSAALILGVLYVILSATLLFVTPINGHPVLIARGTFLGGEPTIGQTILTSGTTAAPTTVIGKAENGILGVDNAQVVKVSSNTIGTVTEAPNGLNIDGKFVEGKVVLKNAQKLPTTLKDQVVVKCEAGACDVGSLFIVDQKAIYGEVRNGNNLNAR